MSARSRSATPARRAGKPNQLFRMVTDRCNRTTRDSRMNQSSIGYCVLPAGFTVSAAETFPASPRSRLHRHRAPLGCGPQADWRCCSLLIMQPGMLVARAQPARCSLYSLPGLNAVGEVTSLSGSSDTNFVFGTGRLLSTYFASLLGNFRCFVVGCISL